MTAAVESMNMDENKIPDKPVDREKTCPLLLRVFCNTGRHHNISDYTRGNVPSNELQIYTWMDATLREITALVKEVNPDARSKGTYFEFSLVSPDQRSPSYRMREIGVTCSGQKGADDNKTLAQASISKNQLQMQLKYGGIGGIVEINNCAKFWNDPWRSSNVVCLEATNNHKANHWKKSPRITPKFDIVAISPIRRFVIGDYMDISITPPSRMQPVVRRGNFRQY